jgi:transposase
VRARRANAQTARNGRLATGSVGFARSRSRTPELLIAKLRRMQFGRKSEKLDRQIEQLELRLEELVADEGAAPVEIPKTPRTAAEQTPRQPLPEHLPREIRTHLPESAGKCTECGGRMKSLGEDVAEQLEYVPASFRVIRHVRPKFACVCCDHISQAPAPSRPIERGLAGPGLLAHVLVSKFADHVPLYRQSVMYAREGVGLDRSLLAKWVGHAATLLQPLVETLRRHVMSATKLHADDTPVPVLAPGNGKTKTGRLWVYVRDDRASADMTPPAVWFAYTPDRKGIHPQQHLESFNGTLQADAYGGYQAIYETGRVTEAACWAHYPERGFIWRPTRAAPVCRRWRLRALGIIPSCARIPVGAVGDALADSDAHKFWRGSLCRGS